MSRDEDNKGMDTAAEYAISGEAADHAEKVLGIQNETWMCLEKIAASYRTDANTMLAFIVSYCSDELESNPGSELAESLRDEFGDC